MGPTTFPLHDIKRAPGPKGHWLLGSLKDLQHHPLRFLDSVAHDYGDIVRLRLGPEPGFILRNPDHIQYVLIDNHRNYHKKSRAWNVLRDFLGDGLLTSEGGFWLRQRRLMQPAFHRERLSALITIMAQETQGVVQQWNSRIPHEKATIDIASEMMRLTLRVASRALLGTEVDGQEEIVERAMRIILETGIHRIPRPYLDYVPTVGKFKFNRAMKAMDSIIAEVIAERHARKQDPAPPDLLSMLMEAKDEDTGEMMNDRQLRDEVMTMFVAGHETTANALAWTFYVLDRHPEVESRLREEVSSVLGSRLPQFTDIPKLTYTLNVVKESMRLYPPVWMVSRLSVAPDEIGGFFIPKGSTMMISPYITHRHPGFWKDPLLFNPDRFSTEDVSNLPRFAYFPFGGGPRQCIGNSFALMEAQIVLSTIIQNFRLRLPKEKTVEPEPLITLRPKGGLHMFVSPV